MREEREIKIGDCRSDPLVERESAHLVQRCCVHRCKLGNEASLRRER